MVADQKSIERFTEIRADEVIAVDKADVRAPGNRNAGVARGGHTPVFLVDYGDTRILFRPAVADFRAFVRGAIVNQNDLQIPMGLIDDAFNASVQILFNTVDRNNYRDQTILAAHGYPLSCVLFRKVKNMLFLFLFRLLRPQARSPSPADTPALRARG